MIHRPIHSPIHRPVIRKIMIPGNGRGAVNFSQALALLQPYSPRVALNFQDTAGSLFTDTALTSPITTLGTTIGSMTNFVAGQPFPAQSDAAKRPAWDSYTDGGKTFQAARFDGVNDCLVIPSLDMSDTDKVCVIAGVRKLIDTPVSANFICELTNSVSLGNGGFALFSSETNSYRFVSKGESQGIAGAGSFQPAPDTAFLVAKGDINLPLAQLERNGSLIASNTDSQGSSNYSNASLNIGARNNGDSLPFDGWIHYLFVLGQIPPDAVLEKIRKGLSPRIGEPV